ncbi:unnamed protein product [Clonostachys solani]|uniref:NACHT domain-containing protein n=1 Tax=Clonostachys solani TaxID=160281 RepID=A0A9P0ELE9_9HYPO|nr:unnamed protein product [Clonostachys solani]
MNPPAGLGTLGSVIQLVDFAVKIIATQDEIQKSPHGCTRENRGLEAICQGLQSILGEVETLSFSKTIPGGSGSQQDGAVKSLHALCEDTKKDCKDILGFLQKLKIKDGGHMRWGSMNAAFKSLIGRQKVDAMEGRLRTAQSAISIHLGSIICDEIQTLRAAVSEFQRQNARFRVRRDPDLKLLSEKINAMDLESPGMKQVLPKAEDQVSLDAFKEFQAQITGFHAAKQTIAAGQAILSSLYFQSLPIRHRTIPENFEDTFSWIFTEGVFRRWVEQEGGIFWITGKPGSGKSTLMKFLADNYKTRYFLNKWASPFKGAIAAHYFWHSGTEMQKSLLGFLQTLLFEILVQMPGSIASILPSQWERAMDSPFQVRQMAWSLEDLSRAINNLVQIDDLGIRLCLFVDGLDEFDGDHQEVCKLLVSLVRTPHIKICLSSRPWNVFEDEFGGNAARRINIHELTGPDIEKFVKGHLFCHRHWNTTSLETEEKQALMNEIRQRAKGVFLWVVLVTKSLCDGLTNQDKLHDFMRRLELLPNDLEDLFKHILNRVDPIYWQKSAEYLKLALDSDGRLPAQAYDFHESDHEDKNYAILWPIQPLSWERLCTIQGRAKRRIAALTGGLLEAEGAVGTINIDFLHRTVSDFLRTRSISNEIHERTRRDFDVHLSLAKLHTVLLKSDLGRQAETPHQVNIERSFAPTQYVAKIFQYASKVRSEHLQDLFGLLDSVERALGPVKSWQQDFKKSLLKSKLSNVVSRKLSNDASYFSMLENGPIDTLLTGHSPPLEMLDVLFRYGHDLNEATDGITSPWSRFFRSFTIKHLDEFVLTFRALVSQGASPNGMVRYTRCDQTVFCIYVILPFSYYTRDVNVDKYLSTLDVFLDYGADFGKEITFHKAGPIDERHWWPQKIDSRSNTVAKAFIKGLKLLGSNNQMEPNRRIVFETTRRILLKRGNDRQLVSELRKVIPKAFPEHMTLSLLRMLPQKQSRKTASKRKRAEDEFESNGTRVKRRQGGFKPE